MRNIAEKISYLQGLSAGLNLKERNQQEKILHGVLNVLEDIEHELRKNRTYIFQHVHEVSEEESLFERNSASAERLDCVCDLCGRHIELVKPENEEDIIEIICPNCDEIVYINEGAFDFEPMFEDEEPQNRQPHN